MTFKTHEEIPGWGPSPARHQRIREWAAKNGIRIPIPYGQVPTDIEMQYEEATGDREGRL